jgi:hypothetical protein
LGSKGRGKEDSNEKEKVTVQGGAIGVAAKPLADAGDGKQLLH